jgi:DNA-binding NarL/FixJ family response regulator
MFRALIADDDSDHRLLQRVALTRSGRFEIVAEASDGDEAVRLALEHRPDLVLLDLSMPRVDGLEALPQLRAALPDTKVIVLSSFARDQFAPAVLRAGAVGYLEKGMPQQRMVDEILTLAGLLEVVEEALAAVRANLAPELQSAGTARKFVDETLRRWDCGEQLDVVTLLVSEVVTNAIVHAGTEVEVSVGLTPDAVRIEVTDKESELPVARRATDDDTSGRGLALLDALASAWGVEVRPEGKVVWFEVPRLDQVGGGVSTAGG